MGTPTTLEILLFLALLIASATVFLRRFVPILQTILKSKKEPGFELDPLPKRIQDFVWEVLLQAKVIKERPLPGLAHAFVFWGFCAFGLVTVNHFGEGLRLNLISRESGFGQFYFGFAAAFAIVVMISITGLTIRRFIVRPKWLEPISLESGFIALLIFLLMATYLAAFWLAPGTLGGRLNWWAHTCTILLFLPLVPHTKHLHLILSPITILLSRGTFSKIPPLVGDEDFGIDTGKDITNLVALQAYSCVECGRCTEHCPANNTGKVLNPKQVILGLRKYLRENGPNSEVNIVDKEYVLEEALFQCTSCGACEYQCPVGIEHVPIIIGLRRARVNTGKWENEYGGKLFLALEKNGNALGMSALERDKFIKKNTLPLFDGSQEYCLWLGCMGSYDPQGREIILSLTRVLNFLGVTWGVLKKEKCSGDPARRLGNDLVFTQLAEFNLEQMKAAKVIKLLSICPHCVRTISEDWKEAGATVEIEHHSEFLARHIDKLPKSDSASDVVFHDPCYLGRYRGIYEEPRTVAGIAGHVVNPARAEERSFCCGAGGGLAFLGEEKGKRVSIERTEQLIATGAPVLAAACPFCNTMFRDALTQVQPATKLMDIAQIAAASLPVATEQPQT